MKKAVCFLLLLCVFFASCQRGATALETMSAFAENYGALGDVYATSVAEGERGYIDEAFFVALFGKRPEGLADFAVFLGEDLDGAEECGALTAETAGDALLLTDVAWERISLILSTEKQAGRNPESVLKQYGKTVVYGVFRNREKAEQILDKLY